MTRVLSFPPRAAPALGAIGIIAKQGRLLLVQRGPRVKMAGRWCFPGGRIEPGETTREAVVRELVEELGLLVEPQRLLGSVDVPGTSWKLAAWTVRVVDGRLCLDPSEIAAARWLRPEEVRRLADGMPSNERVLELLERAGHRLG